MTARICLRVSTPDLQKDRVHLRDTHQNLARAIESGTETPQAWLAPGRRGIESRGHRNRCTSKAGKISASVFPDGARIAMPLP